MILQEAHDFAIELAQEAGALIHKETTHKVAEQKDRRDLSTEMDLAVERLIVNKIKKKFPDHNIISEEDATVANDSEYTWIIDPIDGTKHFVKDLPLYAVSIALDHKGEPVMGVVHDPNTSRTYHAHKGGGAFMNGNPISVSDTADVENAMIYADITKMHELPVTEQQQAMARLHKMITGAYRVRAFGLGSLGLCYVAQGGFDAYFDLTGKTKYVDLAAGAAILKEAGGAFSDLKGDAQMKDAEFVVGTNQVLHDMFRGLLK